MENYLHPNMEAHDLGQISALGLAHCGDAVFELLVRTWLCRHGGVRADDLHRRTVAFVSAGAQSRRVGKLLPLLTEEELAWYKHGRNSHPHGIPKNASPTEYARATGLETLFGALWLTGQEARANELFVRSMEDDDGI